MFVIFFFLRENSDRRSDFGSYPAVWLLFFFFFTFFFGYFVDALEEYVCCYLLIKYNYYSVSVFYLSSEIL